MKIDMGLSEWKGREIPVEAWEISRSLLNVYMECKTGTVSNRPIS